MHFCCSHYISSCFLSTPPFILSLSCFLFLSLSLSLSLFISAPLFLSVVARHMSSDALYQIFSSWSILLFHTISFHSSYKILQLFTDYLLRLPSSELLEKHLFRSRANRRLVDGETIILLALLNLSEIGADINNCNVYKAPITLSSYSYWLFKNICMYKYAYNTKRDREIERERARARERERKRERVRERERKKERDVITWVCLGGPKKLKSSYRFPKWWIFHIFH